LATGVNPGFVMDLLPLCMNGCQPGSTSRSRAARSECIDQARAIAAKDWQWDCAGGISKIVQSGQKRDMQG